MNNMELLEKELRRDVLESLRKIISDDYVNQIANSILDEIVEDVKESSAFHDEGVYNFDDIKLSIGRILLVRLVQN